MAERGWAGKDGWTTLREPRAGSPGHRQQRTDDDHEEHRGQEDVERLRAAECQKEDGIEGEQQGGSHDRRRETRQQSKGPGTGKGEQRG